MNAKQRENQLTTAVAWGAISGLRSMLAPALLSRRLQRSSRRTGIQQKLTSPAVRHWLELLAVGELVMDKAPFVPSRLTAISLLGRGLSGALVGLATAPPEPPRGSNRHSFHLSGAGPLRALLGAGAALGAAFAGYHARRVLSEDMGLPSAAAGVLEDGVALWIGSRAGPLAENH